MGGHPNEALVQRLYDAFNAGDMDTLAQLFTPDIIWSVAGNSQISGDHKGQDAVFSLFALCGELTGGNLEVVPETITAKGDDTVVSTHRVLAKRGDKQLNVTETENITIKDGKIAKAVESVSDQAESDAFWA